MCEEYMSLALVTERHLCCMHIDSKHEATILICIDSKHEATSLIGMIEHEATSLIGIDSKHEATSLIATQNMRLQASSA